jgi:uncharacterized protein (TIGR00369 family)
MISGGCATLAVSDFDRAVDFYTKTLGLTVNMRFGDSWAVIDCGGGNLLALIPKSQDTADGLRVGLGASEDFDGTVATLKERGVSFSGPIKEDRHVKLADFSDPDGNPLYLTSQPPKTNAVAIDPSSVPPFFDYLGLRWNTLEGDRVSVEMDIRKDLCGPAGIIQGGITATLVDVAAASTAALAGTDLVVTTEMTLHYLAPGKVGPIRAIGELLRSGSRTFAVEVRVFDVGADNRLMTVALAAFVQLNGKARP